MADPKEFKTPDKFDRAFGALSGLPDVTAVPASTVVGHSPMIGAKQTYIIQTLRQRGQGDTIFVEYIDDQGSVRLVLPPGVADAIARQRDALTTRNRKRAAKEQASQRKAAGIQPGFMKNKPGRKNGAAQNG